MSGFEPSLPFLWSFFAFSFFFFGWVRGVNYYRCSSSSFFHSIPKIYLFLAFQVTKRVGYLFLCSSSKPKNSQKNPGSLRPTLNTLYKVTPGEYQGNRWPCSTMDRAVAGVGWCWGWCCSVNPGPWSRTPPKARAHTTYRSARVHSQPFCKYFTHWITQPLALGIQVAA